MPRGDREKLKADPEDGTTPIANLLLEAIAIARLTGKEKGILLYLCRRTYGWSKNGKRLKEVELPLSNWARKFTHKDTGKVSSILSGLVRKKVIKRVFLGAGKGYIYSINTRVAQWGKGCLNRQLLSEMGREGLPKTARGGLPKKGTVALLKKATPIDTKSDMPKEILNKVLNKDIKKERGEGGEGETTPSPVVSHILEIFNQKFPYAFGREPDSREQAMLRDLALELAGTGVTAQQIHDAFCEATKQSKMNVSYVRAVLLAWLGKEKKRGWK